MAQRRLWQTWWKRKLIRASPAASHAAVRARSRARRRGHRECGNAGTYGGALRVYNVTTRRVRCRPARRFARRYITRGGPACNEDRFCTYRGWSCRNVGDGGEIDSCCVRGGRVIRFQYS